MNEVWTVFNDNVVGSTFANDAPARMPKTGLFSVKPFAFRIRPTDILAREAEADDIDEWGCSEFPDINIVFCVRVFVSQDISSQWVDFTRPERFNFVFFGTKVEASNACTNGSMGNHLNSLSVPHTFG
jgi:hypothetical protein